MLKIMSNMLIIKGNTLVYNDNSFLVDDLITDEFFKIVEPQVHHYNNQCFEVNELYLYFIQKYLAIQIFVQRHEIKDILLQDPNPLITAFIKDIAKRQGIKLRGRQKLFEDLFSFVKTYFWLYASVFYLVFKMLCVKQKGAFPQSDEFAIIRDRATDSKLKEFDVGKYYDNLLSSLEGESVYSFFSFIQKINWGIKSLYLSTSSMGNIRKNARGYMGRFTERKVMEHYSKRTASTSMYYQLIETLFKLHKPQKYYTGLNLERYAIVEETLAKKYGVSTICVPHGLEYGFKFPYGFTSDTFYTTSKYASEYLNKLYSTNKFVFDSEVATKMFKRDYVLPEHHEKRIVFFTESRDVYVNKEIIDQLLNGLKNSPYLLYLKLHPADKKDNYSSYNVNYIDSFDESICGNICIARKSTVLLEATYNNSVSAAILVNEKDKAIFYTFPSLQSERIKVYTSVDELMRWIFKLTKAEGNPLF